MRDAIGTMLTGPSQSFVRRHPTQPSARSRNALAIDETAGVSRILAEPLQL
jgi:hypothetical protein